MFAGRQRDAHQLGDDAEHWLFHLSCDGSYAVDERDFVEAFWRDDSVLVVCQRSGRQLDVRGGRRAGITEA